MAQWLTSSKVTARAAKPVAANLGNVAAPGPATCGSLTLLENYVPQHWQARDREQAQALLGAVRPAARPRNSSRLRRSMQNIRTIGSAAPSTWRRAAPTQHVPPAPL